MEPEIDQQVGPNNTLTVSYIGNKGSHLFISRENNYAPLSTFVNNPSLTPNQNIANNLGTLPTRRRLSAITCGTATPGVNGPCYGPIENWIPFAGPTTTRSRSRSTSALQRVQPPGIVRLGKYLDVVSYTAEGGNGPRNPENFAQNYGPSDNNVRNRFAGSYIYILPTAISMHGITGAFINGWQNQAIITIQTGEPYSINSSSDTAATGMGGEIADGDREAV